MNDYSLILALRLVHIVVGVFWVGSIIFLTWFLTPAARAAGAAGPAVMQQLMGNRRMPVYLVTAALLTILSGLTLYRHDSVSFGSGWMHTGSGMTFSAGAALAIIGAVIGIVVNLPLGKRITALGASIQAGGRPPTTEQAAAMNSLQARLATFSYINAVLLVLATAAMAVARYIP
jgi:uncharacterized membrane protein